MTQLIHEFYKTLVQDLEALYPEDEARAIADSMFENYFNLTPVQRVISGHLPVDADQTPVFEDAVSKLLNHVPLQYVLGYVHFMDLQFEVNPAVLIPRPETEEMLDLILKQYLSRVGEQELRILDIGTGSGCIAIVLKHFLPNSIVTAVDISPEALGVATDNAKKNGVEISFIKTDILDGSQWSLLPECELIVSNPPYVTHAEKQFMLPNVLHYEPHTALFVPDNDPLVFYRNIMAFATARLSKEGSLWFEINEKFGDELKAIALHQGFKDVNIYFDIRGKSRFLHCSK